MKLAEALLLRSDLNKKLLSLRDRIVRYAVVQEGEQPHENPEDLHQEASGVIGELKDLSVKIDRANQAGRLSSGVSMTDALAERMALTQQHALIVAAIEGTKREPDRYGVREIKWVATVDLVGYQKRLEDLAKKIRELNAAIQEANWKIDI
jgi:hypothetical protein